MKDIPPAPKAEPVRSILRGNRSSPQVAKSSFLVKRSKAVKPSPAFVAVPVVMVRPLSELEPGADTTGQSGFVWVPERERAREREREREN